jgi:hypothetical protein
MPGSAWETFLFAMLGASLAYLIFGHRMLRAAERERQAGIVALWQSHAILQEAIWSIERRLAPGDGESSGDGEIPWKITEAPALDAANVHPLFQRSDSL